MTNRTQISSPLPTSFLRITPLFPLPFPQGSKCNNVSLFQNFAGEVWRVFFWNFFFFCLFFWARGNIMTQESDRQSKGEQMESEGLKGAWCFSECQVEFLGPRLGNERAFGVEMMAIRTLPSSSKETYCTLELLQCGALVLSVRCTGRNVTPNWQNLDPFVLDD